MGVDLIVFVFAAVNGFHIKGMPQDKRETVFGAEVGEPVPSKQAFGCQDDLITGGSNGFEQCLWGRCHVTVSQCFTGLIEDAHVHGAGVKIDPAVKRVLCGVESH